MTRRSWDHLKAVLHKGWQLCLDALYPDYRRELIERLRDAYLEAAQDVTQFLQGAAYMHYPQDRARLLRIAAEEQAHVMWLREQIVALGGAIPDGTCIASAAKKAWEALRMGLEKEKRSDAALVEAVHIAEHVDPAIAEGLRRIRQEERQHRQEFLDMLVKSDPETLPLASGWAVPRSEPNKALCAEDRMGQSSLQEHGQTRCGEGPMCERHRVEGSHARSADQRRPACPSHHCDGAPVARPRYARHPGRGPP